MPLVNENEFDQFLDVAVRDESDTDAFRRARRRPSFETSAATVKSDGDNSSSCISTTGSVSSSSVSNTGVRKVSLDKIEHMTSGSSASSSTRVASDADLARETSTGSTTSATDSSTTVSESQDSTAQANRIIELENEVARLKFQAADFRAQSDYYRMQHRQLRVQFEDLQAFCQQLQEENEELRSLHQEDSNKRSGGIWPFQKEEPTKLGPPLQPPESLSHVDFEPYSAPEQFHEDKLKEANVEISKVSSHSADYTTSSRASVDTDTGETDEQSISSSETTPRSGNVSEYADLSLEDGVDENTPSNPPPSRASPSNETGLPSDSRSSSWWPFSGQSNTKTQAFVPVDLEVDEDFDLKDFRSPVPRSGDAKSRLEELQRKSALAAKEQTDELRHSGHLIGMSMI